MSNDKRIGIFDSGVGGFTVVRELLRQLPNERMVYFGDSARVPYGSKSGETVINYSLQNTRFLLQQNVKMIVVACNTASSLALERLRDTFDIPILGVIGPGVRQALDTTRSGRIGVIGTSATVNSHAYKKRINKINKDIEVFEQACPLFVPLAEENVIEGVIADSVIDMYLSSLMEKDIDTLVLGCTHYPLLKDSIARYVGSSIKIIDSASAVIDTVGRYLSENNLSAGDDNKGEDSYFVSDLSISFLTHAKTFLKTDKILFRKAWLAESWSVY